MKTFLLPLILISLNGADIERYVIDCLQSRYPVDGGQYVCDFSTMNFNSLSEFDSVAIDGFGKEPPRGPVVARLSLYKSGERAQKLMGVIKVAVLKRVLTCISPIKAGEPFMENKVEMQTKDIASIDETPLENTVQLQGFVAARYLASGKPLTPSCLQAPSALHAGDRVEIIFSSGPLALKADGIVRENGSRGKRIRVMNADSRKIIDAVVIDSTTVAINDMR